MLSQIDISSDSICSGALLILAAVNFYYNFYYKAYFTTCYDVVFLLVFLQSEPGRHLPKRFSPLKQNLLDVNIYLYFIIISWVMLGS